MKRINRLYFSLLILSALLVLALTGCQFKPQINLPIIGGSQELNLYNIDPVTLDPAVSGEMTSHQYITQIFSGLVRLDDEMKPAPDIAERWQVSKDGKTYTFYLHKNAKFSDGRAVKAEDFKYSWERACNPATESRTAGTFLGDIVGVKEVLTGQATEISGIKVIDDYTLQVTIDAPKSYFLSELTYPTAFVVSKDNVRSGERWWQRPIGTGPFKLKQWDKTKLLVLERNDLYYGETARIKAVNYHLWAGLPMNLYETGKIDVTSASVAYIDKITDKAGQFYTQLVESPELSFYFIGFNHNKPPFDDVNVRRAFAQAINKDKIVSLVFRGTIQRADGILPPGIPGFNKDLSGLKYDVNEAKQLIAASKYGDVSKLPPITITTSGWGGAISNELEVIINDWRNNLGVEVKVRQLEPDRYLYYLKEEKDEMFDMGWVADYPHPQDFLDVLFGAGAENNYGDYNNPEVEDLLFKASIELDEKTSLALYQQVEQKMVADAACIPLWFGKNYTLVKPYIKGYKLNPLGFVNLNKVVVEPH